MLRHFFVSLLVGAVALAGCTSNPRGNTQQIQTEVAETNMSDAELKVEDQVVGEGAEATDGKMVTVHYTGTLTDGTKFDSSVDRGQPFQFVLGAGQVIKGWDMGVAGMKVGGKRTLTIPAELAYGDRQVSELIPAGSTLLFDVELLDVE